MKKITTSFRDKKCVFGGMWHAQKQPQNFCAKDDEEIKKHFDRFQNQVEITENH